MKQIYTMSSMILHVLLRGLPLGKLFSSNTKITSLLIACFIVFNLSFNPTAYAQPTGFIDEKVGTNWNAAVGMAFSKDGNRMYVWEKGGKVWIVENGNKLTTPLIDISEEVGDWRDHGLLGFALDPNFESNGYYYLLYVVDRHHLINYGTSSYSPAANDYSSATIGRLTRYTARSSDNKTTTDPNSRKILIGESISKGLPILYLGHGVGSLVFGEDGSLLLSIGDGASAGYIDTGYDPAKPNDTYVAQALKDGIITEKENIGAYRAQQVESLNGKILRVDPSTGNGMPNNPFYNSADPRSAASRVWALGFRNAFRFTVKPGTGSSTFPGVLYIGDVGWYVWEEISIATKGGMNFGWPIYEGLQQQEWYYHKQVPNTYAPNPLYGQNGCSQQYFFYGDMIKQPMRTTAPYFGNYCSYSTPMPSNYKLFVHARPAFEWKHEDRGGGSRTGIFEGENAAVASIGASNSPVTGPQFSGSSVTGGIWYTGDDFPAEYKNTYFFGDFTAGWIKSSTFDNTHNPKSVSNFVDRDAFVVALATNPVSGGLYYIKYASEIHKVSYKSGNLPPKAVASADKLSGPGPLTVKFTGSGSTDPEGQVLAYEWNFGDGSALSKEANPSHTFSSTGVSTFTVTLKVTDAGGLSSTAQLTVSLNNTAPVVSITTPTDGTKYPMTQNSVYNLTAAVSDKEHTSSQLSYEWQTVLHHNQHQHPEPVDNKPSTTVTLSPIGCDGETYFYRINLKVTDAGGLSGSDFVDIYPECSAGTVAAVAVTSPSNGATYAAGENIPLKVSFAEVARDWSKVEYYNGTTKVAESSVSPFSATWSNVPGGSYSVKAKATDAAGHIVESAAVSITVTGSNTTSGTITREFWDKVYGTSVTSIPVTTPPTSTTQLTLFQSPSNIGDNYGQRVRGYVTAPVTGQYTFWIASDDGAELFLSTSEDPAQKRQIAYVNGWTNQNEWTKYSTQQSVKITLEAGKRYYIEALMIEGGGGDNLSVGWQLPSGTLERPISGSRLSPYGSTSSPTAGTISRDLWLGVYGTTTADIPVTKTPSSSSELQLFEAPINIGNNYGQRVRGYVTAPVSGMYTFWIASDDYSELYLSTSEDPANKKRIAYVNGWVYSREWTKYATQTSAQVYLEAGKRYYIEALMIEGGGGDNLAVGWQLPSGTLERPIPGNRLSPYGSTSSPTPPPSPTGTISRDFWANVHGTNVSVIPVNTTPTSTTELTLFQSPVNVGDNYGQRVRGYVTAPVTGQYTFWIASDDGAELYLSTSEDPGQKRQIAYVNGWTYLNQWTKYPTQQSVKVTLEAGKRYYIEALHVEQGGGDNLSVGWQLPDGTMERPIPGNRLSPYNSGSLTATSTTSKFQIEDMVEGVVLYPNPFTDELTVEFVEKVEELQSVTLYDMAGRAVYKQTENLKVSDQKLKIELTKEGLKPGFYMLRIIDSNGKSNVLKVKKM